MENQTEKSSGYAIYALVLLMTVYILNFLDRTIIYILFTPLKAEFNFTDTQLVMLGTTSFVILYTVLGVPFGRIADKGSRAKLIAIGLAVWSLFSGLTGFAWDFWSLFFCRLMVGVGEATLGPAAADVTEIAGANLRGLAIAIFFFSVNIMAYLIGSNLIGKLNDLAGIVVNPTTKLVENAEMMRYTLLVCPFACLLGAICLLIGSKTLRADNV